MRVFNCTCGNPLFFDNVTCTACGRWVGWCPGCAGISSLEGMGEDRWRCTTCDSTLLSCANYKPMRPLWGGFSSSGGCQTNSALPG